MVTTAASALAPPVVTAQQEGADREAVRLRLRPDSGKTLTYAHRVRARMEAPPQLGGGQTLESRMRLRQTAVRVGSDSVDYRMELVDIRLSADSVPEDQLPDLTRYEGTTFLARMTTGGELVRLNRQDGTAASGEPDGMAPVQRSVRMSGFPSLPGGSVLPGDSWVDTTVVETGVMRDMQQGRTFAVSRTTLEGLTQEGGSLVATLSVTTAYTFRPADSSRAALRADMSGSGSSSVRFDVTHGRYLRSESAQDYTVNLRYPDSSRTFSVRFSLESEAQLVGVGQAEEESEEHGGSGGG